MRNAELTSRYAPALILCALLMLLHLAVLDVLPFYRDELAYVARVQSQDWNYFGTYRFYRFLGIIANYLAYYVTGCSPLYLSALLATSVFLLLILFARCFEGVYGGSKKVLPLFCIIFLAVPFSLDLLLLRVYAQLVSVALVLYSCYLLDRYCLDAKKGYLLYVSTVFYALSLFVYEITLLMPLFFVTYLSSRFWQAGKKARGWVVVALLTGIPFLLYLFTQFYYARLQPKMSAPIALKAQSIPLSDQLMRKSLLVVYNIQWSFSYMMEQLGTVSVSALLLVVCIVVYCGHLLWHALSDPAVFLDRKNALFALGNGAVLNCCFLGVWSYYWFAFKYLAAPYYYNYYIIAVGTSCMAVGALSLCSSVIVGNRGVRSAVLALIMMAFLANLAIFLSHRFAVRDSLAEIQSFARTLDRTFDGNKAGHEYIAILNMPPETGLARNITAYNSALMRYLVYQNPNWASIKRVANHAGRGEGLGINLTGGVTAPAEKVILVDYRKGPGSAATLSPVDAGRLEQALPAVEQADPCQVSFANYRLFYSVEDENFRFRTDAR